MHNQTRRARVRTHQGVGDGVPHALDGAAGAALPDEPVREGDVVERAHVVHGGVEVEQRLICALGELG